MKHTWVERIRLRMEELGMTQEVLASQLDVTRAAVGHYLMGRRVPPLRQFHKLAQVLQTDPAWLQFGVVSKERDDVDAEAFAKQYKIPILSWEEAAEYVYEARMGRKDAMSYLPSFYTNHKHWYALQIKNDSMVDVSGRCRSFFEGDYIFIDPERKVVHGDFVVVLVQGNAEVIFRQYVLDGGVKYLRPLNAQYEMARMEKGTVICGTVVGMLAGILDKYV